MRSILIVGIGAGNPDQMTVQAIAALNRADVLFIPSKGAEKDALRQARHAICDRFITRDDTRIVEFDVPQRESAGERYRIVVEDWHARTAALYAGLFERHLEDGEAGAFLVWGDPSLYDSTLRIMEAVKPRVAFALDYEVFPGITSVQALAARHRIPINRIGKPVRITTGRRLTTDGLAADEDAVVMLDGEQAFARLPDDTEVDIFWGAYLGTLDEIAIAGRLSEVKAEIERVRAEARLANGWIMDTYLLRRRRSD